ncbi:MAG: preprotein translocase subunit SecE [Candidatus Omnitrophota bacterium]|nr:preprotein translocase subunit SecE [Candidatus Omnitrophota bacterium]
MKNFGSIVLAISAIIGVILFFRYFSKIQKFINEVIVELGKVSWSTRDELISATWVVILSTAILAVFIFVVDSALSKILSSLIR